MADIMCRPLVERLFLPPTAHSHIVAHPRLNAHMRDCCQSTCRFASNIFIFSIFSLDATLNCILLAVVLPDFGHRPGFYTSIAF